MSFNLTQETRVNNAAGRGRQAPPALALVVPAVPVPAPVVLLLEPVVGPLAVLQSGPFTRSHGSSTCPLAHGVPVWITGNYEFGPKEIQKEVTFYFYFLTQDS